jgi:hypothetical protein
VQNHGLALSVHSRQGPGSQGAPGIRPVAGLRKIPNFQIDLAPVQAEVVGTTAKPSSRKRKEVSHH